MYIQYTPSTHHLHFCPILKAKAASSSLATPTITEKPVNKRFSLVYRLFLLLCVCKKTNGNGAFSINKYTPTHTPKTPRLGGPGGFGGFPMRMKKTRKEFSNGQF